MSVGLVLDIWRVADPINLYSLSNEAGVFSFQRAPVCNSLFQKYEVNIS